VYADTAHIAPDDMSISRRRSWPYRGGAVLNFRFTEFSEVRMTPVLC
jgi:hypothetical protein